MGYELYNANKKSTGSAISFSTKATKNRRDSKGTFIRGEKCVFVRIVKQKAWDDSKQNGVFKDGEDVYIKLNPDEIGTLMMIIEKGLETSEKTLVHFNNNAPTYINLKKYKVDNKLKGYTFSITKVEDGVKSHFSFFFNLGRLRTVCEFFVNALHHINNAYYGEDIDRAKEIAEYRKRNSQNKPPVQEVPDEDSNDGDLPEDISEESETSKEEVIDL